VFEKSLKQELEGQLLSDRNQFLSIAAYVFLQCIPKWGILDDLSKPAKTVTSSRIGGQGGRPRSPIIEQRRHLIVTHLGVETRADIAPLLNKRENRKSLYALLDKEGIPLPESDRYEGFSDWSGLLADSEDLDARDTLIRDLRRSWHLLSRP